MVDECMRDMNEGRVEIGEENKGSEMKGIK